jgi:hypothetical protein
MASQDPTDRPSRHTELVSEPIRPDPQITSRRYDPLLDITTRPGRRPMRPRRPIYQAGITLNVPTSDPTMRTLTRNPHCFCDMGNRHPLYSDPLNQ